MMPTKVGKATTNNKELRKKKFTQSSRIRKQSAE